MSEKKLQVRQLLLEIKNAQLGIELETNIVYDTIYGQTIIDTVNTFKPFRDFSSSISMTTKQYGKGT